MIDDPAKLRKSAVVLMAIRIPHLGYRHRLAKSCPTMDAMSLAANGWSVIWINWSRMTVKTI